ncbi:MAG: transcriptional regulator with XRE-family HTH domain [Saprospiraceae bacterium]|jgi:transcriptional regulator with XRE-family HTH domain
MNNKNLNQRIIFGLKVKQFRQERGLSFSDLAARTGMSISYLNEIEKGKKFPKIDKVKALAETLDTDYTELISSSLTGTFAPVGELLRSNFLNELPLDLFGIELSKVVEIISNAPVRVGAFISTLVEISRNYALGEESFYHSALRAYTELHYNYFEDIEQAANLFIEENKISKGQAVDVAILEKILKTKYKYEIVENGLKDYPEMKNLRSVFVEKSKRLLLNGELTEIQRAFQYGKELAYNYRGLKGRSATSSMLKINTFDEVLNHFKAAYFSVAILMSRDEFIVDLQDFFQHNKWDGEAFLHLIRKYNASPEMLFNRLTNVLPWKFGMRKMFFMRVFHDTTTDKFQMDKELHLDRQHQPHGSGLFEKYCRRWLALSLLKDLHSIQQGGKYVGTIVGAQRSKYFETDDEYFALTLARPGNPGSGINVSVTIGILIDEELPNKIKFLNDPSISSRIVNNTCERCPIEDCTDRAAPASIIEKREHRRKVQEALNMIIGKG